MAEKVEVAYPLSLLLKFRRFRKWTGYLSVCSPWVAVDSQSSADRLVAQLRHNEPGEMFFVTEFSVLLQSIVLVEEKGNAYLGKWWKQECRQPNFIDAFRRLRILPMNFRGSMPGHTILRNQWPLFSSYL